MPKYPEYVAIFGSRNWGDRDLIRDTIVTLPANAVIVSGGARGVDQIAESIALECGLVAVRCIPAWDFHGKRAGYIRNKIIFDIADRGIAFWDGSSRGTKSTIDLFQNSDKQLTIVRPKVA